MMNGESNYPQDTDYEDVLEWDSPMGVVKKLKFISEI